MRYNIYMNESFSKLTDKIEQNEDVKKQEGINFVFSENPDLEKIALEYSENNLEKAKEIYGNYLETIFPESKVKDIVYHGGPDGIEVFDKNARSYDNIDGRSKGRFFTGIKNLATVYAEKAQIIHGHSRLYPAVLDVQNPVTVRDKSKLDENFYPNNDSMIHESFLQTYQIEEVVVFNPKQIHILGSKKDVEMFKKYLEEENNYGNN